MYKRYKRFWLFCIVSLLALLFSAPAYAQDKTDATLNFGDYMPPVEDYRLANGLRVILARDDSAPVVAVNLTYHVGGANDPPGRSGFAHLFEHMMFHGSAQVKAGELDQYLTEIGADYNAYTEADKTVYHTVAPANQLPRILWIESDRMASLVVDQSAFDTERQVVIQEYNQRIANAAYGAASLRFDVLPFLGYPPYERPTIGNVDDLNAATLSDVQHFHSTYYVPNNATLAIVGAIDFEQTKLLVQAYFGHIATGSPVTPVLKRYPLPAAFPVVRADQQDGCQIGYEETIVDPLAQLPAVWATVATTQTGKADGFALGLLGRILGEGDSSRFQKDLVQSGKAAFAYADVNDQKVGDNVFQFRIYPNPGADVSEGYTLLRGELDDLIANGVSAEELARAQQQTLLSSITQFRGNVGDTAEWLQDYALRYGDPTVIPEEIARYQDVTLDDIQRVAKTYLCDRPLNIVTVVQQGEERHVVPPPPLVTAAPLPPNPLDALPPGVVNYYSVPAALPTSELSVPAFITFTLDNGLQAIFVEQHKTPEVNLRLYVGGSDLSLPAPKQGVATLMTDLLTKGTTNRSADEISAAIEGVGGSLSAQAFTEFTGVFASGPSNAQTLIFDLLADVTLNPTFPQDEFVTARDQLLASMKFDTTTPNTLADRQLRRIVYSDHPYSFYSTPDSVNGVTTQDLLAFHQGYYLPTNSLLVIEGDLTPADAKQATERVFGAWTSAKSAKSPTFPKLSRQQTPTIYLIDRPGAEQSTLRIGNLAMRPIDPERYAFAIANAVLGGSGLASRLNKNLREQKGYTYGVYSSVTTRLDQGMFFVAGDIRTVDTGDAITEILRELRQIRRTGVMTDELAEAKGMLSGQFTMSIADPASLAGELAVRHLYGIPLTEINDYTARIEQVSASDVISAARHNIDVRAPVIVVVGDATQVKEQLQQIAPVDVVDASGAVLEVAPLITETATISGVASAACACPQATPTGESNFEDGAGSDNATALATPTPAAAAPTEDANAGVEPTATPTPEG